METVQATLCFVLRNGEVLLGMKKKGLGRGYWNGFGGKVEVKENVLDAARRELWEESGVTAASIEQCGLARIDYLDQKGLAEGMSLGADGVERQIEMHIFRCYDFVGRPVETVEMRPKWFAFDGVPYGQMWPDDKYWLPQVLSGGWFEYWATLKDEKTLLKQNLEELALPLKSWQKKEHGAIEG